MFVVSCFQTSQELCYYLWGEDATAKVLRVSEEHHVLQEYEGEWRVTFEFQNAKSGALQLGFIFLDGQQAKQFSVDSEIEIQYYSESLLASRLKGEDHSYWIKVFLGSIAVSVVSVAVLTWHGILEQERLDNRKWWIK